MHRKVTRVARGRARQVRRASRASRAGSAGGASAAWSGWFRAAVALLSIAAAAGFSCAPAPLRVSKTNILLLVIDCLRADRYGADEPYARPLTPNLDALLAEGVSFTRAFTQAPWTRPSLPTLLTGIYPSEHGLGSFEESAGTIQARRLPDSAVTVPELLKALGYSTAMIGEQHQLSRKFGLDQGFDVYNFKGSKAKPMNGAMLNWLDSVGGTPFFSYLHYLELHWPYCPPHDVRGRFTPGYEGRSFCFQWRQLRDDLRAGALTLTDDEKTAMEARYDEELLGLDQRLGELFEGLRSRGLWDETLIVVTSDHGEEFYEHGGIGHGATLHDELIAVPLVVKPPASWGVPAGRRVDDLTELVDLAPTFLTAAGVEPGPQFKGRSLLPGVMDRKGPSPRDFIVAELFEDVAVRTESHKLIVSRGDSFAALFDLRADPAELRDVSASHPEIVRRLTGYLRQWRRDLVELAEEVENLDAETVEGLRSLGYIE